MKNAGNPEKKPLIDTMKELGQQYGVKVTDLSERGIRAIGIIGRLMNKSSISSSRKEKKGVILYRRTPKE